MDIYQVGDTIRLRVVFRDWSKTQTDPDTPSVTCNIYNNNREIIAVNEVINNKISVGEYYMDFTPDLEGVYIYEFSCIVAGTMALRRGRFLTRFVT